MSSTTTSAAAILTPEQVGDLVVQPTLNLSSATDAATVISCESNSFRVPIVNTDPAATFVAEGAEIPVSDVSVSEIDVHFAKLAGLSVISSELAADSSPEATAAVGDGLARDLSRKLDAAFYGNLTSPAPAGLGALAGTTAISVGTGGVKNLDVFLQAIANAETLGCTVTSFVANPADALTLAQLKQYSSANSNMPLLQPDPTQPTRRLLGGVPLLVSAAVTAGTVWALPNVRALIIVRQDAETVIDKSAFFTSDRVAVRATMRVGFAFPQPASIAKINVTGS